MKSASISSMRASLLGVASCALLLPMTVAAQAPADTAATVEEIVVTGSRIQRTNENSSQPVQILGSEAIAESGVANIQTLLLDNPTFGAPTFSRVNSNFDVNSSGQATVDLRNLGQNRTLTLVNGRRYVSGVPGDSAVDLNSIPTRFIERVEILTSGASAIYGSDAVAGVVNIILKKDFEGVEVDGQYGQSSRGDGTEKSASVTMGSNFADDRGNAVVHFGYSREGAIFSKDRKRSAVDQFSTAIGVTGDPADIFTPTRPFFSSFVPQGRFITSNGTFTFDRNNQLLTGFSTNGTATRPPDGFNRSEFRSIAIPTERFLLGVNTGYQVNDWARFFLEANYNRTETQSRLEPFPAQAVGGANPIFPGGRYNIQFRDAAGMVTNIPFVPQPIIDAARDLNGDGLKDIDFARRLTEIDNRGAFNNRQTFRSAVGFEGEIPGQEKFKWDVAYVYGQTSQSQTSTGQVNAQSFRDALTVDLGPNGQLRCANAQARAQGCVPINVFGFNSISPEAANYVRANSNRDATVEQHVVSANITGPLFDLPAGPFSIATGVEYRDESSVARNDALTEAGLNLGNRIPSIIGSFDVKEAYVEFEAPLLADMPGVKRLTLNGAFRAADYSTVGGVNSYTAGVEYEPMDAIRFRGGYARSTRAPNVGELFDPGSQNFPTGLVDPCAGVRVADTSALAQNCRKNPALNARIIGQGVFTPTQAELQGITGFDSGNPNLQEETSDNYNIGVVLTPDFIPQFKNLSLTADYYNYKIKDVIDIVPRQFALDQCFRVGDGLSGPFCALIGRNTDGALARVDSNLQNLAVTKAAGIDFTANHSMDLEDIGLAGQFSTRVSYTLLTKLETTPLPGEEPDSAKGEIDASKHRFTVNLNYAWEGLSLAWTVRYIGSADLDDQFLTSNEFPTNIGVGSKVYNDAQIRYNLADNQASLYVGVRNLFDTEPAPIISGLPGNDTGTETAAGTYDPIGRFIYGGVSFKF
jgi:iron complex outermembrane recepter protein